MASVTRNRRWIWITLSIVLASILGVMAAGYTATIVVPRGNNADKNRAMRALGAELVEHGDDFNAALDHAQALAAEQGEVDFSFAISNIALPRWEQGLVRLLVSTGARRSALLPAVPTLAEAVPDGPVIASVRMPITMPSMAARPLNSSARLS